MKSFINILRWIGVLPLAALAYWLAYFISKLLYFAFNYGNFSHFIINMASAFASGIAYILIGCLLAPNYKNSVAYILGALMLIIITISLTLLCINTTDDWVNVVCEGISSLIGCIIAIISFTKSKQIIS